MARFELQVNIDGVNYFLDTYPDEAISLNYSVAEIQDISARNSSFSKTIRIPETKNNRLVLNDFANLDIDSQFNANKKVRAYILVDTLPVFEGFLQVRKFQNDYDWDKTDYEVVVYADNDNFFKNVGENFIEDLDFSELNHIYSHANVVASWTASWGRGYYYPLIDYGFNWNLDDVNGNTTLSGVRDWIALERFYPATNVKYIWDKIFREYGYSYQSDFLNTDTFKDLYIPFNRGKLTRKTLGLIDKFAVGMTNITTPQLAGANRTLPINTQTLIGIYRIPFDNENTPYGDPNGYYNPSTFTYQAPANSVSQRFVCNFDISFVYRRSHDYTEQTFLGSGQWATSITFKREFSPTTGLPIPGGVVIPTNGSNIPIPFTTAAIPNLQYIGTLRERVIGQISTDFLDNSTAVRTKLYANERVWVEVRYSHRPFVQTTILSNNTVQVYLKTNEFFNVVSPNIVRGEMIEYNRVVPYNFKQKDFLLSIIRMFNLYVEPLKDDPNTLLIEPREDYYKKGRIKDWSKKIDIRSVEGKLPAETQARRNILKYKDDTDFYNTDYKTTQAGISYGEQELVIDNDFITGEKKIEIAFSPTPLVQMNGSTKFVIPKIGKLNNNLFESTDFNVRILTKFRSSTKTTWTYSSYLVLSNQQWCLLTTDSTYNPLFSNATHNFKVGDYINILQNNTTVKPMLNTQFRVEQVLSNKTIAINILAPSVGTGIAVGGRAVPLEGMLPLENLGDQWAFEIPGAAFPNPFSTKYKAYPYLGHFDNPFEPNYDINFGQVVGYYYPDYSSTNDTLYEDYWRSYFEEITDKNSRIITANFYLTATDMADLRFNDNIFINGQYYKINKISNYDPSKNELTQVELLKTREITVPKIVKGGRTRNYINPDTIAGLSTTGPIKSPSTVGQVLTNTTNGITKGDVAVVGRFNNINSSKSIVVGDSNTISADRNYVFGIENEVQVDSGGNFVFGNYNTVVSGVQNSFVIGQNAQVSESNTFMVQAKFVIGADIVDAGRNEVLNRFPDSKMNNLVSASRNEVRELGSDDVVNILDGGRYVG